MHGNRIEGSTQRPGDTAHAAALADLRNWGTEVAAKRKLDRDAQVVENYLNTALAGLRAAMREAEHIGYGDQFRGALQESIEQTEFVRRQLS